MTTGNAYRRLDTGDQIEGAAFRELVGVPDMVQKGRRPTDEQFASLLMLCCCAWYSSTRCAWCNGRFSVIC